MPNLTEECSTFGMNSIYNGLPCLNLLFNPYTWGVWIPLSSVRDTGGFSYEKTSVRGPLRVIEDSMRLRNIAIGSYSSEWCQNKSENGRLISKDKVSIDIEIEYGN